MGSGVNDLERLADETLHAWLARIPVHASRLGFREYDEGVPDPSREGEEAARRRFTDLRDQVGAIPKESCDGEARITRSLLLHRLDQYLVELDARQAEFDVGVAFAGAPAVILHTATKLELTEPVHAERFLRRVEAFERYLEQSADRLRDGIANRRTPGAQAVQASVGELDRYLESHLDDDPVVSIEGPPQWSGLADWRERLRKAVDTRLRPALLRYRDVLATTVLPAARPVEQAGLSWLPDGEGIYASAVRTHTTTALDATDIHELGHETLARVHDEARELGQRLFGLSDISALFDRLRSDPALRFESGDEILSSARAAITRAEDAVGTWFARLPRAACVVKAIPSLEAASAPRAYYQEPARDGSRPGTFWANTAAPAEIASFDAEALAFHEALPGHHLQLGLLMEAEELSLFRRLSIATATAEGWGLYAEGLADEMGLYSGDLQRLGMLALEAMRACRAVVDTGLHALGWSRERAVEFILANSAWPAADVEREVDRYLVIPGQALGYLVGLVEIRRLRREAERRLGERFDLPAFHDALLTPGALPLPVLAEVLDAWAEHRAAQPA